MDFIFEPEDGELFAFTPEPPSAMACCWECGALLEGCAYCEACNIIWVNKSLLRRLDA